MSTGLECRLRWAVRIWVRTASASRAQCNRAVFREAVGSFVHALQRRLLLHQPRTSTETFDDEYNEYKYSLPKRGSPCKGLGVDSLLHEHTEWIVRVFPKGTSAFVATACIKTQCFGLAGPGFEPE